MGKIKHLGKTLQSHVEEGGELWFLKALTSVSAEGLGSILKSFVKIELEHLNIESVTSMVSGHLLHA